MRWFASRLHPYSHLMLLLANKLFNVQLYPEVVTPDCYSCICAELDVHSLAMNTVLESNRIHEIEGTASDNVITFSFTGSDVRSRLPKANC
jgi:hypothetical protein